MQGNYHPEHKVPLQGQSKLHEPVSKQQNPQKVWTPNRTRTFRSNSDIPRSCSSTPDSLKKASSVIKTRDAAEDVSSNTHDGNKRNHGLGEHDQNKKVKLDQQTARSGVLSPNEQGKLFLTIC